MRVPLSCWFFRCADTRAQRSRPATADALKPSLTWTISRVQKRTQPRWARRTRATSARHNAKAERQARPPARSASLPWKMKKCLLKRKRTNVANAGGTIGRHRKPAQTEHSRRGGNHGGPSTDTNPSPRTARRQGAATCQALICLRQREDCNGQYSANGEMH